MLKIWADVAWDDYCNFFELNQKKLIKMVHDLIKDIERNGVDKGRGQPEPLKYELTGYWSRRIDLANRLQGKSVEELKRIAQTGSPVSKKMGACLLLREMGYGN